MNSKVLIFAYNCSGDDDCEVEHIWITDNLELDGGKIQMEWEISILSQYNQWKQDLKIAKKKISPSKILKFRETLPLFKNWLITNYGNQLTEINHTITTTKQLYQLCPT